MILQDLKYAFRTLTKHPGFALVAVLSLALGIGANTAVFSIVEAVLLRPLPVKEPERLVMVWERNIPRNRTHNVVNPANYIAWSERSRSFEAFAAFTAFGLNFSAEGEPARLQTGIVTGNFFETLGVRPLIGRVFGDADGLPNAPRVVILSEGLWKERFGADPKALGRGVTLNGRPATVVGVMPARFALPPGVKLWVPLTLDENARRAGGRYLFSVARLKPGVSVESARAEMDALALRLQDEEKDRNAGWAVTVAPMHADLVRDVRPATLVLAGAVGLVLLIACGNLANLLLARALGREREIAVRRALGASSGRLIAQLLTESLLLAIAGGVLGVWLAALLADALLGIVPTQVQALFDVSVNTKVLLFTLALSCLSALVFGLVPALSLAQTTLGPALREGTSGSGQSRARRRLSRLLVCSEIALSVVLVAGATVLLRSFERLSRVNPGFDPAGVLSLEVSLPGATYPEPAKVTRFYSEAVERLARIPGVRAAGAISWRPLPSGGGSSTRFWALDRPAPPPGQELAADIRIVTTGTFKALGVPLLRGRDFEASDAAGKTFAVIVSESTARELWPGQEALGKRVKMSWGGDPEGEIVGVVGDVRLVSLESAPRSTLYWHQAQVPNNFMTFLLRSAGDPLSPLPAARAELLALDKDVPVASVATLEQAISDSLRRPRFLLALLGAFAAMAALLATIGLFGVLSYAVGQRLPELGLRLAIGARPADLLKLVLGDGVRLAGVGLGAGLVGALLLSRFLTTLLFEVSPRDPVALALTAVLVGLVSLAAAARPALRAARIDPARALRAE
jgi:putative ABC transport system permease protein